MKNRQLGVCGDIHVFHIQCTTTIHHQEERGVQTNTVWEVVKHLKEKTTDGVVVDTHVCVSPITSSEAGEVGADVDSDGNSLWFCN